MFKSIIIALIMSTFSNAFVPTTKPNVNFKYLGDIKPTGYFDPLLLTTNLKEREIKYVREAELQHARAAMLAFVGLSGLDFFQDKLAVNFLYDLPLVSQIPFWMGVGAYEFARMGSGWKNPFVEKNMYWKLEEDYQPGNVFKLNPENVTENMYNMELANGRLAMLGTLGYIAQEVVTGIPSI